MHVTNIMSGTKLDFHCVCASGPSRSVHGPQDVIYFSKAMTNSFSTFIWGGKKRENYFSHNSNSAKKLLKYLGPNFIGPKLTLPYVSSKLCEFISPAGALSVFLEGMVRSVIPFCIVFFLKKLPAPKNCFILKGWWVGGSDFFLFAPYLVKGLKQIMELRQRSILCVLLLFGEVADLGLLANKHPYPYPYPC